jgi:ribosomal-protein-serine acetyltransferase
VVIETRSAILDFLFDHKGCARACGFVYARNLPSVSNYLTLGFTHEGTLRGQLRRPGGERGDAMVFGMLREEWLARRSTGSER